MPRPPSLMRVSGRVPTVCAAPPVAAIAAAVRGLLQARLSPAHFRALDLPVLPVAVASKSAPAVRNPPTLARNAPTTRYSPPCRAAIQHVSRQPAYPAPRTRAFVHQPA